MKRFIQLTLVIFLLTGFSGQGTVRMSFFKVSEEGGDLVISWQTEEELDVREYELQRMTRFTNGQFVKVEALSPHGPDKAYFFTDEQIFKSSSERVDYRLEVIYTDGVRQQLAREQVNYTSTAIRRTWGSIKAMFQ